MIFVLNGCIYIIKWYYINIEINERTFKMGISVKISYEFELNGQIYSKIGAEWGETEKEEDIKDFNNNEEEKEYQLSVMLLV